MMSCDICGKKHTENLLLNLQLRNFWMYNIEYVCDKCLRIYYKKHKDYSKLEDNFFTIEVEKYLKNKERIKKYKRLFGDEVINEV